VEAEREGEEGVEAVEKQEEGEVKQEAARV